MHGFISMGLIYFALADLNFGMLKWLVMVWDIPYKNHIILELRHHFNY